MLAPGTSALLAILSIALTGAIAGPVHAAEPAPRVNDATALAKELARLRGEVESLAAAIDRDKDDRRVRLRGLADQASQIEIELRREVLRKDELERRVAEGKATIATRTEAQRGLTPVVLAALDRLRAHVASALPFRLDERIAAVDEVRQRLRDAVLGPAQGFARVWELVEDELRLGRESALDRQVVTLPSGGSRLAQVVRIGMVALFYRIDGQVGRAVADAGWTYQAFDDEADVRRLDALFESFERRVRSGFFEIPWLTEAGR